VTTASLQFRGDLLHPVVSLSGEIDGSNADELAERVAAAIGNDALALVLDLSGVSYLDSSGVRMVFRLARGLRDRQQELQLVIPTGSRVGRPLGLAGVGTIARVVPDLASLLEPEVEGA
jgi:anti-anti-sigma factor